MQLVNALLEAGADINTRNQKGNTALICASSRGYIGLVNALLEASACAHPENNEGGTALIYAINNGHTETASALLKMPIDSIGAEFKQLLIEFTLKVSDNRLKVGMPFNI